MLDATLAQQLQTYLTYIKRPITLSLSLNGNEKSNELKVLVEEIAAIAPSMIEVVEAQRERAPMLSIAPRGETPRIHFAAIPLGHEFTSLVLALLQAGGHPPKVEAATLETLRTLPGKHRLETFISLSCQNCPDVVQALNLLALMNPNVEHTMIDGALFTEEATSREVLAVPLVFDNAAQLGQGRMSMEELIAKLDSGAQERQTSALNEQAPFDVLVVGAGPAGAAAAIYAARKGIRTGVVAERIGGQVLDTVDIENLIAIPHTEGGKLAATLEQNLLNNDVILMGGQKVQKLSRNELLEVELASGAVLRSKAVILAMGARWRDLNVPGEIEYRTKGVAYCPHCDGPLFKGKKVSVIGGGNSGIEAAIDLAGIVEQVTVLEFAESLRADEVLVKKARSLPNVTIITNAQTTEVIGDGSKVIGLRYRNRADGSEQQLDLAGIFVQIGLVPSTEWLKGGEIELSRMGEVVIDSRGATSMAGVFAAGDSATTPYKQIIIAMGSGATAALSAFDYLIRG